MKCNKAFSNSHKRAGLKYIKNIMKKSIIILTLYQHYTLIILIAYSNFLLVGTNRRYCVVELVLSWDLSHATPHQLSKSLANPHAIPTNSFLDIKPCSDA